MKAWLGVYLSYLPTLLNSITKILSLSFTFQTVNSRFASFPHCVSYITFQSKLSAVHENILSLTCFVAGWDEAEGGAEESADVPTWEHTGQSSQGVRACLDRETPGDLPLRVPEPPGHRQKWWWVFVSFCSDCFKLFFSSNMPKWLQKFQQFAESLESPCCHSSPATKKFGYPAKQFCMIWKKFMRFTYC